MRINLRHNRRQRCYREGGFLFTSSKSTTNAPDQRVAASEGSLAVGQGATYTEGGGVNLAGSQNAQLAPNLTAQSGDITISDTSGDVLLKALDKYAELSSSFGSSLNQFVSQSSEDQSKKVTELLAAVESAKESQDTAAQNRKIFLWIAAIAAALFAYFASKKR